MKKLLFLVVLKSCFNSYSQALVYQTDLNKDKSAIKYTYLPVLNKIVIKEANSSNRIGAIFNKAIEFDTKSNGRIIYENSKFLYLFSSLDNQFFGNSMRESIISSHDMNFYNKEAVSFKMKDNDFLTFGRDYFKTFFSYKPIIPFDKNYFYAVTNDNGSNILNIAKDNIKLNKLDVSTQNTNLISIKKPDIARLKTKDLINPGQIPFQTRFYANNTFEIITKSVSKDLSSSTLYRDIYDLEGKFIKELIYNYSFSKGYLVPSNTSNSYENMTNSDLNPGSTKLNMLDFNDYFIDTKNNDFYIYGILDSKQPSGTSIKEPLGFYIIKYSDKGVKVWEKVYDISATKGFNDKSQQYLRIFINLNQFCEKESLSITISGMNNYSNYYNLFYKINKELGEVEKTANFDNKVETNKGNLSTGAKYSIFENLVYDKNKYFDSTTFLTTSFCDKVKNYIDKIITKKEVFFNSIVSQDGIWLFESDNETYYKVLFF